MITVDNPNLAAFIKSRKFNSNAYYAFTNYFNDYATQPYLPYIFTDDDTPWNIKFNL